MDDVLRKCLFVQQKKRGRDDGGRNKENIIEPEVEKDTKGNGLQEEKVEEAKKEICYEIKHSDVMGR